MEAQSVEDGGQGVLFNVYCYNVQPGVGIDYSTGDSWEETEDFSAQEVRNSAREQKKHFHLQNRRLSQIKAQLRLLISLM